MRYLLKQAAGTFGLRVSSMALAFFTSIVLARMMGPTDFGTYSYTISWIYILSFPASLGFGSLMGKEVAIYQAKSAWRDLSGIFRLSILLTLLLSTFLALASTAGMYINTAGNNPYLAKAFGLAMIALPFVALNMLVDGSLRGFRKVLLGLLPEMLLGPLFLLCMVIFLWLQDRLTIFTVLGAYSISAGTALAIGVVFLSQNVPTTVKRAKPKYHFKEWILKAFPFIFFNSINQINSRADVLMLGSLHGLEAAGIYAPINRGTQLILFSGIAFVLPLQPVVASLYSEKKLQDLQVILNKTTRLALLTSSITTILLIILSRQYLLIFGSDFLEGRSSLIIRCIGQILTATSVASPMLLSMTGYAQMAAISGGVSAVLNVSLNLMLIPRYSIDGAAVSTAISLLIKTSIDAFLVHNLLGLNSTIFKCFSKKY